MTKYLWAVAFLGGCAAGEEVEQDPVETDEPTAGDPCQGAIMEDDFQVSQDMGPQGDPANWPAFPPGAIVSTTYLKMKDTPEAQAAFGESVGPIQAEFMAGMPGLMGLSFAGSESCGTARTLSVWATEEDMMNFVTGPAHSAAIGRIGEISRGGSLTMSWTAEELGVVSWEGVVGALAAHGGPAY